MLRWGVATGAVFVSLAVRAAADVLAIVFEPGSEELVSPPPYYCSANPDTTLTRARARARTLTR